MGFSYKRFQPNKLSFDNGVFANNNYSYQDFKSHDYSGQNTEVMDITPDNNINNDNHVTEKGIPFEYDSSRHGAGGYTVYYKNNEPIAIHYDNTNIVKAIDSLSCYRLDSEKNLLYPVSIYDDENISSNQYGADQGAMAHNFEGYIKRPEIWDEMQKYYPVESFTSKADAYEFYERYFNLITNTGCGFAAATNIIFDEYKGREDEFYKTFGFPMYYVSKNKNGEFYINYNYEIMELKIFNYCNKDKTLEEMEAAYNSHDSFIYRITHLFDHGESPAMDANDFYKFLSEEYNIDVNYSGDNKNSFPLFKSDKGTNNLFYEEYNENEYLLYGGESYDLYDMDGNLYRSNGGGHYMLVVGWTEDNKPIVTSWGKKLILDVHGDGTGLLDTYRLYRYNID